MQFPARQVNTRVLEGDLRWACDLGLDILLPYLKVSAMTISVMTI
jgi:hypothetical protein